MLGPVYCPGCGGPGKIERDWRGDERIVCDAYRPCDLDPQARAGRAFDVDTRQTGFYIDDE